MKQPKRRKTGSGIVEGVVGLLLIVLVIMACLSLVTGAGLASYYKYKMACVADRATVYVAGQLYPIGADSSYFSATNAADLNANVSTLVTQMLTDVGLPNLSQGAIVSSKMVTGAASGRQFLVVTLTEPALPIIQIPGSNTVTIPLQETAAAAVPLNAPPSVLQVSAAGGGGVLLPGYPPATPPTPKTSFVLRP